MIPNDIESLTPPNNPEPSKSKETKNIVQFTTSKNNVIKRSRDLTRTKLQVMNRSTEVDKFYDDVVVTISKEFSDRIKGSTIYR